jgi:hypothetical protein
MKWTKTKKELDDEDVPAADRAKCFTVYHEIKTKPDPNNPGKKIAEATNEQGNITTLFEWVTHHDLDKLKKKAQRKYEIYCGGFLDFYDIPLVVFKNGKVVSGYLIDLQKKNLVSQDLLKYFEDKLESESEPQPQNDPDRQFNHEIYFEWGKETEPNKIFVTIYLNPAAGNPDPPTPPAPPPPESST